jgi:cell division inhibitor SulA/protein ImuA
MTPSRPNTTQVSLQRLAAAIEQIEGQRRPRDERPVTSGFAAIDRLLPEGGFQRGAIVEYLATCGGSGAASLALSAALSAVAAGGSLVVVDRERMFYPPAAIPWSTDPCSADSTAFDRLIVVRPENEDDERWALDQVLRSPAVAAVLAWPCNKAASSKAASSTAAKDFRRWQLAAELGGSLGFFVSPDAVRSEPSWAAVRLAVAPVGGAPTSAPRRVLRVELLKCRGRAGGTTAEVTIDDETHPLPLVPPLVAPAPRRRA